MNHDLSRQFSTLVFTILFPPRFPQVEAFIQTLRDAQTTNLLNLTSLMIRTCAYGRANVHLYEYRPRVSILLQVGQGL